MHALWIAALLALAFGCQRDDAPRAAQPAPAPKNAANARGGPGNLPLAGPALYQEACASCHGPAGRGDGPRAGKHAPRDLSDPAWHDATPDAALRAAIAQGKGRAMPAFRFKLNDAQLDALVQHVRGLRAR